MSKNYRTNKEYNKDIKIIEDKKETASDNYLIEIKTNGSIKKMLVVGGEVTVNRLNGGLVMNLE